MHFPFEDLWTGTIKQRSLFICSLPEIAARVKHPRMLHRPRLCNYRMFFLKCFPKQPDLTTKDRALSDFKPVCVSLN